MAIANGCNGFLGELEFPILGVRYTLPCAADHKIPSIRRKGDVETTVCDGSNRPRRGQPPCILLLPMNEEFVYSNHKLIVDIVVYFWISQPKNNLVKFFFIAAI